MERRMITISSDFQTREDGGRKMIAGYFSVYGSVYNIGLGMSEEIAPGAFDDCLEDDVRALINHDTTLVLGRTKAKTLTLKTDEKGLYGEIEINQDDTDALNCYSRVQRKDVNQCSFGFDILDEETQYREDGSIHWIIRKVKLYEVSVCTFPAYEDTAVEARQKQADHFNKRKIDQQKNDISKRLERFKCSNS
jgi:HK97 family phage prohead protease